MPLQGEVDELYLMDIDEKAQRKLWMLMTVSYIPHQNVTATSGLLKNVEIVISSF